MYIEAIDATKNNKNKVHLSNGVDFTLYKGELRKLQLQEGDELSDALYETILQEILIPRALSLIHI